MDSKINSKTLSNRPLEVDCLAVQLEAADYSAKSQPLLGLEEDCLEPLHKPNNNLLKRVRCLATPVRLAVVDCLETKPTRSARRTNSKTSRSRVDSLVAQEALFSGPNPNNLNKTGQTPVAVYLVG